MDTSNKTKKQCYQDFFSLVLKKQVPDDILVNYLNNNNDDNAYYPVLADFVINNMRDEIDWSTAIGIIEAADKMYGCALYNGNITKDN